jgi:hypothetical protein
MLDLDGLIDKADGTKLKRCNPNSGVPPGPLLEAMNAEKP